MRVTILLILTSIFSIKTAFTQQYRANLDVRIPHLSGPVTIGGKRVLYYELYATNFGTDTIQLKMLQVSDLTGHAMLVVFDNEALKKRSARIGTQGRVYTDMLPGGSSCVVYIELDLKNNGDHDLQLAHRLLFETVGRPRPSIDSVTVITTPVPSAAPLVLGPPLGKGNWAAVYEPSWLTGHRRVIYTLNGHARIPGRYAIDLIKLDNNGKLAHGNDDLVKEWYGYGADVLAVADGTVAAVRTDFLETPTVSGRERVTAERATGNYISICLDKGKYAFYEHLKPGSIRVKPGQKVKKGQIIASLGFTGQSDGPHLHFHVADKNSPLGAEGIPFSFDHFIWSGSYTNIDSLGRSPWIPVDLSVKRIRSRQRPMPNSVISFLPY
jgi:murein DD-endopeptidase MepM/ murein hydrolase activator NlpD